MQGVQIWSLVGELSFHMPRGQKKQKQKQYCNNFNKVFKNGPHLKKKTLKSTFEGYKLIFWWYFIKEN